MGACATASKGTPWLWPKEVRTGFIWVNSFGIRDLAAPFGGIKRSGVGREGGEWSFEFFCDVKDVVVPKKPFKASFSHR